MLKGSRSSLSDGETPNDRPRKKLSFREPEVMGSAERRELEEAGKRRHVAEKDKKNVSPVRRKISVVERGDLDCEEARNMEKVEGRKTSPEKGVVKREQKITDLEKRRNSPEEIRKSSPEENKRRSDKGGAEAERRRLERGLTVDRDWLQRRISEEDEDELESQAMKVVRTVGQAFEVCHKLSANSPTPADEEPDPLQDLEASSDKDSVAFSDPPRRGDIISDTMIGDDLDLSLEPPPPARGRHLHLEMIPPPPTSHKASSAPAGIGETITSPLSDPLTDIADVPVAGTPLSAHHEIQLLREQLEQQCQQTQAAVAQVHLLRDQLTAETTARIEAQARTHQLLVHNKELLDHITALVSHLQDHERSVKPEANITVIPQIYGDQQVYLDPPDSDMYLGLENRNSGGFVTAPSSPKSRHASYFQQPPIQPMGSLYSLYPSAEHQFQAQLMQRLHPLLSPPVYSPMPPTYYTFPTPFYSKRRDDDVRRGHEDVSPRLDPPPVRRKVVEDEKTRNVRVEDGRGRSREIRDTGDNRESRNDLREDRNVRDERGDSRDRFRDERGEDRSRERNRDGQRTDRDVRDDRGDFTDRSRDKNREDQRTDRDQKSRDDQGDFTDRSRDKNRDPKSRDDLNSRGMQSNQRTSPLPINQARSPKTPSPVVSPMSLSPTPKSSYTNAFASALSTIRTLRVSGGGSGGERGRKTPSNGPGPITRSTSEKVPNRSELMDLVQRTAWARQTK